jgi:transposase
VFIKTTKSKNYEYIKLVESYWESGTTKHRVLFNFGRRDLIKNDQSFINIVKKLCEIAELPTVGERRTALSDCSEAVMLNYGYLAYAELWERLGIASCLRSIRDKSKISFRFADTAFLMAVQHLLSPRSKLATYEHQDSYFGLKKAKLQHLYRTLDKLCEEKEFIENELFEQNYKVYGQKVDVVFYDVTTFAFESVIADELKNFGFSKDCKFNEVQVVMGLLIDTGGLPIGYELFAGNTFDGKTMVKSLENLKKRFGINRVIIVADRGINSKGNLNLIKEAGYGYIVASKIKTMSEKVLTEIFDESGYTSLKDEDGDAFRYKTIDYLNTFTDENRVKHQLEESLIVSFSEKRLRKDKSDRERLIEKAKKLLQNPESIKASNKRGGKKYLRDTSAQEATWELDEKKIAQDARFDGYYGIQTSEKDLSALEVMDAYHTLWRIEDSFRVMKSTLEVRPVFHWTPKRIRGHFMVCFLSFLMERKLEALLRDEKEKGLQVSPGRIQEALNTMQLAAVTLGGEEVYIKAKNHPLGNQIFKKLKLKLPKNISTKEEIESCFQIKKKESWGQLCLFSN